MIKDRENRNVRMLSVWVDEEAGEGAVFVGVSSVNFAPIQLYTHFIPHVQVQDDTVGGVVIVLICILSDSTGPDLGEEQEICDILYLCMYLSFCPGKDRIHKTTSAHAHTFPGFELERVLQHISHCAYN